MHYYYLYALKDPITNEICYIGVTDNPKRRLASHCQVKSATGNMNKWIWVRGLVNIRMKPTMVILEENASTEDETKAIHEYWANGHPLLNTANHLTPEEMTMELRQSILKRRRETKWYIEHKEIRGIKILNLMP